jgi:energy-coupling factor transport system substrate-specific component
MASAAVRRVPANMSVTQALLLVSLCAAVNVFGGFLAKTLAIPFLFLDTVGTFIAAVVLGPWWGAAAGVTYNATASYTFDPGTVPFALVSIAVALLWGYGIRSLGLGRSSGTFIGLGIVVAVVSSFVASPIVLWVYGGATGSASDAVTFLFEVLGFSQGLAVFVSNLANNMADKLIAGSLGLALIRVMPDTYLFGLRLPAPTRFGTVGVAAVGVCLGLAIGVAATLLPHS